MNTWSSVIAEQEGHMLVRFCLVFYAIAVAVLVFGMALIWS